MITSICSDIEKRYEVEVQTYQDRVNRVQNELDKSVNDMKKHLTEYRNLMNVKLSLEKEIDTYRSLLEGQITDLNLISRNHTRLSFFVFLFPLSNQYLLGNVVLYINPSSRPDSNFIFPFSNLIFNFNLLIFLSQILIEIFNFHDSISYKSALYRFL